MRTLKKSNGFHPERKDFAGVSSFSLTCPMDPAENLLQDKKLSYGSPNGSTLLTVLSSTLRLRPEGSLSKEGEHSNFSFRMNPFQVVF